MKRRKPKVARVVIPAKPSRRRAIQAQRSCSKRTAALLAKKPLMGSRYRRRRAHGRPR